MNKKLSTEEQASLVTRYCNGESVRFLADEAGVSRSSVYRWAKLEQAASTAKPTAFSQSDVRALERRASRQERIIRILRASPCVPGAPLQDRLAAVEQLAAIDNINIICETLGVAKGTYYNHILRNKRDQSEYAKKCAALKPVIQKLFDDNKQIFGAGKITAILKDRGYQVAEKTVAKIMHEAGLFSIRSSAKTLYLRNKPRKENLLQQNFEVDAPDQVWVSDITSFNYKEKTYNICVIIDLFARLVVACRVSHKNSTQLVKKTFQSAYQARQPQAKLVFHSDRGSNYTSNTFCKYLEQLGVEQSFSRAGMPYDNSVCESFFSGMKREELYRTQYRSENELKSAIHNYIEFYNTKRPHTHVGYKTPEIAEANYAAKLVRTDKSASENMVQMR